MKNLLKTSIVVVLAFAGFISNAQFNHQFTSSTTVNGYSGNWFNDPGCFLSYSSYTYSYNASKGGMVADNSYIYAYMPVLNFQGNFEVKIEYSSTSSFIFGSNIHTGSGWMSYLTTPTIPATAPNTRATYTIRTGNLTGSFRPSFYVFQTGVTIHSVTVTGVTYTAPTSGCSVANISACADSDGDGECDATDDYPNNPNWAFSSTSSWMNYMYEDLWPSYGDFDFNDLVVSSKREVITDVNNAVRAIRLKAVVLAAGAGNKSGWMLELPGILPSQVSSVTGSSLTDNVVSVSSNGTESGQTNAVVPVFDNFNAVINRAGGAFYNTVQGSAKGTGDTLEILIQFTQGSNITLANLDYNFFMFRTNDRGYEIHEINDKPTTLANMSLLGTKKDASNPNNGEYYVSVDGYPWALCSAGSDYPVEKTDLVQAFLKFSIWAQSAGSLFQDWHTNSADILYRLNTKIY